MDTRIGMIYPDMFPQGHTTWNTVYLEDVYKRQHHNMVDSAGALFSNGSTVLGHVYTVMPEHLNEAGGEFTQAVTFKFNDSYNQVLYLSLIHI